MKETGKIIQELRAQAGYTQKELAEMLHITDKAVSKWERGISLPDVSLLPKLSLLLDTDMEILLTESAAQNEWIGLIDIHGCDFSRKIFDKPLVYYLLSHFLLLGITRIHILTDEYNHSYLESSVFKTLGFDFSFTIPTGHPLMILNRPWFLFGSDLTRQFRGAMLSGKNMKLVPQRQEVVFYFSQETEQYFSEPFHFDRSAVSKTLGRGMVCLNMDDDETILDAAAFVRTYQQNSKLLIASLEEIAYQKKLISKQQLLDMTKDVPYWTYLAELTKPEIG